MMNNLILPSTSGATMTSLDFRRVVNEARRLAGESAVENSHFLKRVEDELEGELGIRKVFVNPTGGRPAEYYDLTLDQCLLVGMRESKAVRRSVRDKIKALEADKKQSVPALPATYIEALQALLESEKAKEIAIATKAEIGHRREATAMNTASQAVKRVNKLEIELDQSQHWSTVKRMEIITGLKFSWRLLKSAGADLGIESKDVFDPNFGTVKAYHADVWREAYALDIKQ